MKVMLVDDDYPVLEFIARTVPWKEMGLQLQSLQENGQAAYEAALADMPDIVLTDIGMPKMDGLALLAKLKEKKPNLRAAILSCHNEFHYAQQAMKLSVQDYLLKDMLIADDLLQLLRRLKESLEQEEKVKDQEHQLRRLVDRSRVLMKEQFIRRTIDQPILSASDWRQEAESFGLRADAKFYVPVLLSLDRYRDARKRFLSGETLRFALDNVLEEAVDGLPDPAVHFAYGSGQSFLILTFQDRLKRSMIEAATEQTGMLQSMLLQGLKLTCTAQIGAACEHHQALKEQLAALLAGSGQRFYLEPGSIATLTSPSYDDTDIFAWYDEVGGQFRDRFMASDAQGVLTSADRWTEALRKRPQQPELVKDWLFKLLLDLRMKFQSMQLFRAASAIDLLHREIGELHSLTELREWLGEQVEAAIPRTSRIMETAGRQELAQARQYVLQRLDKRIGLEEVAEHLHLNASYFSRLFKKELGETFTEFVTRMKMERAKEMLDQTSHSVGKICELLGYENQSYFIKTFKMYSGATPMEYRGREAKK